jgi:glycosyltransferase involved in cell wall biosynthesis
MPSNRDGIETLKGSDRMLSVNHADSKRRRIALERATRPSIALVIPCFNEEAAISKVIADFMFELPEAEIYIFDNNSTDRTAEVARKAGAIVSFETRQGKGNVVKSMFQKVDADVYIMVDGDATYPADQVHALLRPALSGEADMVVGSRLLSEASAMKPLNRLGNLLFRMSLNCVFQSRLTDILSGYRVMTRDFVRQVSLLSDGFQIETELTIQALHHRMRIVEVPVTLAERPAGGESKIRFLSDGFNILWTIFDLFRTYKPLTVFGGIGLVMLGLGALLGIAVTLEFLETGLVRRFPTAILATGMVLSGLLAVSVGLILNTLSRSFEELHHRMIALEQRLRGSSVKK